MQLTLSAARHKPSPLTDFSLSPTWHEDPRQVATLAGVVGVNLAFLDHFQTAIIYAYEDIKV